MSRLQPELSEIQKRYKADPQRMQAEIMRVYKEHGMSPFSSLSGCLPMLLPMPILFALFFVFQNTIEFRGVPFLWLSGYFAEGSALHCTHPHGRCRCLRYRSSACGTRRRIRRRK